MIINKYDLKDIGFSSNKYQLVKWDIYLSIYLYILILLLIIIQKNYFHNSNLFYIIGIILIIIILSYNIIQLVIQKKRNKEKIPNNLIILNDKIEFYQDNIFLDTLYPKDILSVKHKMFYEEFRTKIRGTIITKPYLKLLIKCKNKINYEFSNKNKLFIENFKNFCINNNIDYS